MYEDKPANIVCIQIDLQEQPALPGPHDGSLMILRINSAELLTTDEMVLRANGCIHE